MKRNCREWKKLQERQNGSQAFIVADGTIEEKGPEVALSMMSVDTNDNKFDCCVDDRMETASGEVARVAPTPMVHDMDCHVKNV